MLGVAIGSLATLTGLGGLAVASGWYPGPGRPAGHASAAAAPAQPAQGAPINPKEFVPIPNNPGNNPAQAPFPGQGSQQNCDRILFFYQGRLYQLRPGLMPPNGGNPEFFYMQPYEGPAIPGFPAPMIPGAPGQPAPRF